MKRSSLVKARQRCTVAEAGDNADRFVGRLAELSRLDMAWRLACEGRGRFIMITGPAGIGKTRLCEEGAEAARRAGLKVVWGRCWTGGGAPALWPWQSILRELAGADAARLLDGEADRAAADLDRFARFVAVTELLTDACVATPICIVIDDLHAADPAAVLLTRFVARNLQRLPLVLLVTRRDDPPETDTARPDLLTELERESTPIPLQRLSLDDTRTFLTVQGVESLDETLVATVHRVSGGNPLFLRQLAAMGMSGSAQTLPARLRAAIEDSVRRLSPAAMRTLAVGAVLGRSPSLAETVAVSRTSAVTVLDAVAEAAAAGLADPARPTSFSFSHDLVREVFISVLPTSERLHTHARTAAMLRDMAGSSSPHRLTRRAHHAVSAASRSTEDALIAVSACRDAAASMVRSLAYEQAASLLATAVRLHEQTQREPVPARLLLDRADAAMLCGRLSDAHALFDQAATAAQTASEPTLVAEAALGLGGVWVDGHRDAVERRQVLGLQQRALADLPADQPTLRCRLTARLSAEAVYSGGPVEAVFEALEEARGLDDGKALADVLSLSHHALLRPDFTHERLALAEELLSVASVAGEEMLTLMGLCWQTVDLFHLGDPRAGRSLFELKSRADMTGCRSVLFIVAALEVMLLIRAGKLERAEAEAARCFQLGTEVGDADALAYYHAHLLAIRWLQGTDADLIGLIEEVASSPTLGEAEFTFHATLARLSAESGQLDRARALLDRVAPDGLAKLPLSSTWLVGLQAIVETVVVLDDRKLARQAYDVLIPYAELPIMPSLGVACLGSTHRPLGLAALALGELDLAVEHLRRAGEANIRLGNRPLAALCKADLAAALRRRQRSGDHREAAHLLSTAISDADDLGMPVRAEAWKTILRSLAPDAETASFGALTITRQDQRWQVSLAGREALVDDLTGMAYLAQLAANPGTAIPAITLAAGEAAGIVDAGNQPVLDEEAKATYARRGRLLGDELADARTHGDMARVDELERELDWLTEQVHTATSLSGRSRSFNGPAERARTSVRKAIKRAIDAVGACDAELAAVLRASVVTGYDCCYEPERNLQRSCRRTSLSRGG